MNYGKANSQKLWKFHYDELYRKIHSNELKHIVLMRSWTCYSTWWACCSSLWHIINNKLFGKQNHVNTPLTWKIFVHLSASTLGCLSAPKSFKWQSFDVREKQWNNRRKKIEETLKTLNKHMHIHMHIWTLKHKIWKKV
jgi:hypothetical protein